MDYTSLHFWKKLNEQYTDSDLRLSDDLILSGHIQEFIRDVNRYRYSSCIIKNLFIDTIDKKNSDD